MPGMYFSLYQTHAGGVQEMRFLMRCILTKQCSECGHMHHTRYILSPPSIHNS